MQSDGATLVNKVKGIYAFKVKGGPGGQEGLWIVDAKNGSGLVEFNGKSARYQRICNFREWKSPPPPLSSLITVTFALEAGTRMTALYRQIGELSMRAHKHYKPTLSLNTADRSEVSFT